MMNIIEEAIIYATILHQGKVRKLADTPYILHPLEVAQILSTMTDDQELITAGILHDVVEDTDGTLEEIEKRFGKRVAYLVGSESENKYPGEDPTETWVKRKEESIVELKKCKDIDVEMLWLADKLSNIRSLAGLYSEKGEELWTYLRMQDPMKQCWYYRSIAETIELNLNKTGAFKEFIKHINSIWPGTFDPEKTKYKKYKEVSVEGCKKLGYGAKGEVYRYDDELVIKVYNDNNTYKDVEREIALSRRAFVLGIPTAISFGIVSVGKRYGAMYELVDSSTISRFLAKAPGQVDMYAKAMASLAHQIHSVNVGDDDFFPDARERVEEYICGGVACEDEALAEKCMSLLKALPVAKTLIHGDFHTGNVFLQKGEPILIDMDRISRGHPIIEIGDLFNAYVALGEDDPTVVSNYMGFSYETAKEFFHSFMKYYLDTEDEDRIAEVTDRAALLSYPRMIRKIRKQAKLTDEDKKRIENYVEKTRALADRIDTLEF